jgi:uncharacterized protein (DUF1015 family)
VPRFEPFAGLRYQHELDLAEVTAPPYDVLSSADRAHYGGLHAANVVHVDVPLPPDGAERYTNAAAILAGWRAAGTLVADPAPSFTRYRMTFRDEAGQPRAITGYIGGLDVLPVDATGDVLPHEQTTPKDKSDRLDLTRATDANLSPVWGLSLADGFTDLAALPGAAVGSFTADGVTHDLTRIADPAACARIAEVIGSAPVVIADGHHRYAVARTFRAERRAAAADAPGGYDLTMTLVTALSPEGLFVQAIHRLVSGLPPSFDLRAHLAAFFDLSPAGAVTPATAVEVVTHGALCLVAPDGQGTWLTPRAGAFDGLRDLDSLRLQAALADVPHEVRYQHGVDRVLAALSAGDAEWGVLLRPVPIAEIRRTATEHVLMPPKSTFFAPKPPTGLVIRPL